MRGLDPIQRRHLAEAVARYSNAHHLDMAEALTGCIVDMVANDRVHSPWWEIWNQLARRDRGVRVTPLHCQGCRGRGFNPRTVARDMARQGSPVCGACRGTNRGQPAFVHLSVLPEMLMARYAQVGQR